MPAAQFVPGRYPTMNVVQTDILPGSRAEVHSTAPRPFVSLRSRLQLRLTSLHVLTSVCTAFPTADRPPPAQIISQFLLRGETVGGAPLAQSPAVRRPSRRHLRRPFPGSCPGPSDDAHDSGEPSRHEELPSSKFPSRQRRSMKAGLPRTSPVGPRTGSRSISADSRTRRDGAPSVCAATACPSAHWRGMPTPPPAPHWRRWSREPIT